MLNSLNEVGSLFAFWTMCTMLVLKKFTFAISSADEFLVSRWRPAAIFRNKFASKRRKRFQPHMNNISTLLFETWDAHRTRATLDLLQKETPEFIPPQLWPSNSPALNPVCEDYCKRRCSKHVSLTCTNWNGDWEHSGVIRSNRYCGSHSSVASLIAPEQWCVLCIHLLLQHFPHAVINCVQIWRIWKLEAAVEAGLILEFLSVTTQR